MLIYLSNYSHAVNSHSQAASRATQAPQAAAIGGHCQGDPGSGCSGFRASRIRRRHHEQDRRARRSVNRLAVSVLPEQGRDPRRTRTPAPRRKPRGTRAPPEKTASRRGLRRDPPRRRSTQWSRCTPSHQAYTACSSRRPNSHQPSAQSSTNSKTKLVDLTTDALAADPHTAPADPRLSARIVINTIESLTHRLVLHPPPSVTTEAIAHEITELVCAYLEHRGLSHHGGAHNRKHSGATKRRRVTS